MVNNDAISISEDLTSMKSPYANDDIDFVKFIYDHYDKIFETAEYISVDKTDLYWKRYRLEDFLQDRNHDPNIAWIVLYINQIPSSMDFKDLDSILIPSMSTLNSLRQSYMQYRSHIKSCRS